MLKARNRYTMKQYGWTKLVIEKVINDQQREIENKKPLFIYTYLIIYTYIYVFYFELAPNKTLIYINFLAN